MNSTILNSLSDTPDTVSLADQITRTINGYHVTIRFSPLPHHEIMETVKHILTYSYIERLNAHITSGTPSITSNDARVADNDASSKSNNKKRISA
jgi:hypothetical protein